MKHSPPSPSSSSVRVITPRLLLVGLLLVLGAFVFAYAGGIPFLLGHSSDELALIQQVKSATCTTSYCATACDVGYYATSGYCATASLSPTRWNVIGVTSDHQGWECYNSALPTGQSVTATAVCTRVGDWVALPSIPLCGNGHREGSESCDGDQDSLCPGFCNDSCTCTPFSPGTFCGDNVAQSPNSLGQYEVCDGSSVNEVFDGFFLFPLTCADFLDPTSSSPPQFFPECSAPVSCRDDCTGFDISQCLISGSSCTESFETDSGYPPGDYSLPGYPTTPSGQGGGGGPWGLVCGMSDPQRVNDLGFPIGKDGDGDGGNVDASAGEQCDGGSPGQQSSACSGKECGGGQTAQCGTGCQCVCTPCEDIDWNGDDGTPSTEGNGTPPPDSGCP